MNKFKFIPNVKKLSLTKEIDNNIEEETMLFNSSVDFAYKNGGDLTRLVIDKLPKLDIKTGYNLIIDTKTTMLMPGMFPCIGGWHGDEVPRTKENPQPNLNLCDENVIHYICLIPSVKSISNTEFLSESVEIEYNEQEVWKTVNQNVLKLNPKKFSIQDGYIYSFDQKSLHRGVAANNKGWRFFFRASVLKKEPLNKIRKQVQVYLDPNQSW